MFVCLRIDLLFICFFHTSTSFQLLDKPWSQVGVDPSSPPVLLPSIFIAHRVQQSHCSSIFHRVLLTHALLALSASKSICTQEKIHTNLFEYALGETRTLTRLTYTRLEDSNLISHRVDEYTTLTVKVLVEYY